MLPPGLAKLLTRPISTGAPTEINTTGVSEVADLAATPPTVPPTTRMSTLGSTAKMASFICFTVGAANCCLTNLMFWPSTYPSSLRPASNPSIPALRDSPPMYPTCGTLLPRSACATIGQTAALPNTARNSRRFIDPPTAAQYQTIARHPTAASDGGLNDPLSGGRWIEFRFWVRNRHPALEPRCLLYPSKADIR